MLMDFFPSPLALPYFPTCFFFCDKDKQHTFLTKQQAVLTNFIQLKLEKKKKVGVVHVIYESSFLARAQTFSKKKYI